MVCSGRHAGPIAGADGLQLSQLALVLGYNQPRGGVTSQVQAVEQTHDTIVGTPLATGTEWFEIGDEQDGA